MAASPVSAKGSRLALTLGAAGAVALALGRLHYELRPEDVPNPYAPTHLAIGVSSVAVGAWLAHRLPRESVAWAILAAGLLASWMYASQPLWVEVYLLGAPTWLLRGLWWLMPWPWLVVRSMLLIVAPSLVVRELLGRPRRAVLWAGVAVTTGLCVTQLVTQYDMPFDGSEAIEPTELQRRASDVMEWAWRAQWFTGALAVGLLGAAGPMLNGSAVRRQTRWFVVGSATLAFGGVSELGREVFPSWPWPGDRWELVASLLLPVSLALAVTVDHLLDAKLIVRRAALYATLSVVAFVAYAAVTALLAAAFSPSSSVTRASAAAGAALALVPAHAAARRWIDTHVYGDSRRPDTVLSAIGTSVAKAPGSRSALDAVVQAIHASMKLPFVSVSLDAGPDGAALVSARAGTPIALDESFPIEHAGIQLGRLEVARRSPSEELRSEELELLARLALQVGVVAHDVFLEAQLRSSRQELVVAREEERRRLRSDLHDGLGPTLASVVLGLDVATQHVDDPNLRDLLTDLARDVNTAIDDIRRVVYGLRPPELDEYGLARAVEHHVRSVSARVNGALELTVSCDDIPALPAAVEVAAYRITLEAITNVTRHADATSCAVQLAIRDGNLWVEVTDDGSGLSDNRHVGVGLTSMRDRAEELQGDLEVDDNDPGTRVRARLPLHELVTE